MLHWHCYVTKLQYDIKAVDLRPTIEPLCRRPRLVYLLRETTLKELTNALSYIVRSQDRKLMVCYLYNSRLADGDDYCKPTEIFMSRGCRSRMEVFEVDLAGWQPIPLSGIGDRTIFVGETHTIMVSTDKFPKIAANAVYLNYFLQRCRRVGVYHFETRTATPLRELRPDGDGRFFPGACH